MDGDAEVTAAGDPVCWLERVCDGCGALPDGPPAPVCERCGTPRPQQQAENPER